MYLIELQQISIKNLRKSAESAFYEGFLEKFSEIRPKLVLSGNCAISQNDAKSFFLELERS